MSKWPSIKHCGNHKSVGILAFAAGLLLLCHGSILAGPARASSVEYRVKAAFLYNFTKFVEWPANDEKKGKPFRIGILGKDRFGGEMEALAGKAVNDRFLEIQRFLGWEDRAAQCDILFISSSEEKNLPEILRRLNKAPILTVGDTDGYAARGVMINFFMEANKVRFEINLKPARHVGLKISSRLLKLAVIFDGSAE